MASTSFATGMKNVKKVVKDNRSAVIRYGAFVLIIVLFAALTGGSLFNDTSVRAVLRSALPLIVIGCGAAMVYSCGESDFACGGITGFTAVFGIMTYNALDSAAPALRVLAVFCVTIVLGVAIYVTIYYACRFFKLNSMFASLSFMFILRGISAMLVDASFNNATSNYDITITDTSFFIPTFYSDSTVPIIITVIVVLFTGIMLGFTTIGKRHRSIADNTLSSMQSGTNVRRTKLVFYIIAGVCISIGAVLYMACNPAPGIGDGASNYGKEYMMETIIAMILGGMPISGGAKSRISSVVVGAFTLKILYVGLILFIPRSPLNGIMTANVAYELLEGIIFLALVIVVIRQPKYIRTLPV